LIRFHGISRLDGGKTDGIHLLWAPPYPTGHSVDGFTIFRRTSRGEKSQFCFDLTVSQLSDARGAGFLALPDALVWASADRPEDPNHALWTYRIELTRRHSEVTVSASSAKAAFAGTVDGTVIAGVAFSGTSVTLRGSAIAVVWLVTDVVKSGARICGDLPSAREWGHEKPIVKELQVPFGTVNPSVGSTADGRALAESRSFPEALVGDFDEVSRYANAALARPHGVPAMRVISEKPGDGGNDWDVAPFGMALAPTLVAPWRRGWGFAHLDHDGLTPGSRYDYRIVGHVPRADRDERAFDLHTVPRRTRLPSHFRWGTALVWFDRAPVVRAIDTAPGDPSTIRKGVDARWMRLTLDDPTPRVVVDTLPGTTLDAKGFRYNAPVGAVSVPSGRRALLDFGADVDAVVVEGHMAVAGIIPTPLDPALDPQEQVEISQTIYGIEFASTPGPDAPDGIDVVNLSDPARTASTGVHDANRGFGIAWDAPPAIDPAAMPFLPSSSAAPPTEVVYYVLERTWDGSPFTPAHGDGLQVSGRNAPTASDIPSWGFDLLLAFPPADAAPSSHSETVHAVEVFEPDELHYGEQVTYRVSSVDATGRLSPPRVSAATELRKYTRPPAPTTPPSAMPTDPDQVPRSGVQVTLLQHDDPELTAAQRAVGGGSDVVVVRWGWGREQREFDPEVSEFRVYRHESALAAIELTITGPAAPTAGGWTLPVTASRPLAANEFADVPIVLGLAYRITGHPAGTAVTLTLAASPVDAGRAPTPAPVTVNRTTQAELDPEYWDHRELVVARIPASGDVVEPYEVVLPASWVAVSDTISRQRAAYGVTSADHEPYIPDRRAAEPSPRVGNESTVGAAEVVARYFGRPTLAIADLADVPVLTFRRQAGDASRGSFRPADYAPPGATLHPRMIVERIDAPAVLSRLVVDAGAISTRASDGVLHAWALSAADADAIRSGKAAGLVPDRFLAHAAARLDGLEDLAEQVAVADPAATVTDTLPNRPSRWLYRLRAIDAGGRPSTNGQVLAVVVEVPSPARAAPPRLTGFDVSAGTATVTLDCEHVVGDPYVFVSADSSLATAKASLATIRNRDDLAPMARLVVRDETGRVLPAVAVTPGGDGLGTATVPVPPDGMVAHVWALSVSPDGVPSRLVGPLHADATRP
jgi:hypothetical protein